MMTDAGTGMLTRPTSLSKPAAAQIRLIRPLTSRQIT